MEQEEKKDGKKKKSTLFKVIIFIIIAFLCYKIGRDIISGMKKASTEYSTQQESSSTN